MNFVIIAILLLIAIIVFCIGLAIGCTSANGLADMRMERIEDDLIHIINFCKEHITDDCKAQDDKKESDITDGEI